MVFGVGRRYLRCNTGNGKIGLNSLYLVLVVVVVLLYSDSPPPHEIFVFFCFGLLFQTTVQQLVSISLQYGTVSYLRDNVLLYQVLSKLVLYFIIFYKIHTIRLAFNGLYSSCTGWSVPVRTIHLLTSTYLVPGTYCTSTSYGTCWYSTKPWPPGFIRMS